MAQKKWLVESTDASGNTIYKQEFTDHEDALSMYKHLKESDHDTNVSINPILTKLILG